MRSRRARLAAGAAAALLLALALALLLRPPRAERVEPEVAAEAEPARVARPELPFEPSEPEAARAPLAAEPSTAPADERAAPDDLRWVEGRVVFPADTPLDERATVVARAGRQRVASAPVAADGAFSLGLARDVRRVELDLDARWLALAEPVAVSVRKPPEPLVLEPLLGGALRVELVPPDASYLAEVVGCELELRANRREGAHRSSTAWHRSAAIGDELSCAFRAIDPALLLDLSGRFETLRPIDRHSLSVEAGRELTLRVELRPGVLLRGSVRDEVGAPLPQARLELWRDASGFAAKVDAQVRIDEDGRFTVGPAVSGELTLGASCDGYLTTCLELGLFDEGEQRDHLELVLARGETLVGHVELEDGSPPGYCELVLEPGSEAPVSACDRGRSITTHTDRDGRFEAAGLLPHTYDIHAQAWARERDRRGPPVISRRIEGVRAADGPLRIVLGAGASVRGLVRDERGAPLEGVKVFACDERGSYMAFERSGLAARSGADGVFELEGLEPGPYAILARLEDRPELVLQHVFVPLDAPLELVLPTPAAMTGLVLDADERPLAGAVVSASGLLSEDDERTSAADGRFTLEGVPAGLVQLVASADGFAPSEPLRVQLAPGERRDGLVLRLRALGRIEGTLLDARGRPDAGVEVRVTRGADGPAISDEEGAFAFDGLPPGGYIVRAALPPEAIAHAGKPGGGAWLRERERVAELELHEGETARVMLRPDSNAAQILLHGTVSAGGRPLAGAELSSGDWVRASRAWTDDEGVYELGLPGPGRHAVRVVPADGGTRTFHVDVPDAARVRRDFELGAASIAGRVLDHEGTPAAGARVTLSRQREEWNEPTGGGSSTCDAAGRFELGRLDSGRYTLAVTPRTFGTIDQLDLALGAAPLRLEGLALSDGERVEGLELRLPPAGVLTGRVLDASGLPAARAQVVLHDDRGRFLLAALNVRTDDAGRFRVTRAGGTVRVFAQRAGEASAVSARIELDPARPARIELQLGPATALRVEVAGGPTLEEDLELSVRDGDGHGLEHALDAFPAWQALERPEPTLPGRTVGPLPPGRYEIEARTFDGRRAASTLQLTGQPTERLVLTFSD